MRAADTNTKPQGNRRRCKANPDRAAAAAIGEPPDGAACRAGMMIAGAARARGLAQLDTAAAKRRGDRLVVFARASTRRRLAEHTLALMLRHPACRGITAGAQAGRGRTAGRYGGALQRHKEVRGRVL